MKSMQNYTGFVIKWVKVQNFQNPDIWKFNFLNLQDAYKNDNFELKWLNVPRQPEN